MAKDQTSRDDDDFLEPSSLGSWIGQSHPEPPQVPDPTKQNPDRDGR